MKRITMTSEHEFACKDLPDKELVLLPVVISYELVKIDE